MRNSASLDRWDAWREIHSQPTISLAWGRNFDPAPLRNWIDEQQVDEVWFCGAGTSAFVGDTIVAGLDGQVGPRLRSVTSMDLVARHGRSCATNAHWWSALGGQEKALKALAHWTHWRQRPRVCISPVTVTAHWHSVQARGLPRSLFSPQKPTTRVLP